MEDNVERDWGETDGEGNGECLEVAQVCCCYRGDAMVDEDEIR